MWGSQMDLSGGLESVAAHSQSSSDSSDVLTPRAEARPVASSSWGRTRCLSCLILIQKSSHWRRSEQWLMCFGSPKKGLPASKQTISNWIIQAITLAYQVRGLPSPVALRAHSTRGMASSRALLSGVPFQEICDAARWSSPHTFIRFYSLNLPSTPGARVLSP